MKLEAKDRKNPTMVCVATITEVKNGQLLIHFDGWSSKYDYWCDPTTPDIHPIGWCASHHHHLQIPNGESICPVILISVHGIAINEYLPKYFLQVNTYMHISITLEDNNYHAQ